jgi:hypothetical protein
VDEFADGFLGHAGHSGLTARQLARRREDPWRGYL